MTDEIKGCIASILPFISLQRLSKEYFGRHSSWLYHKLNGDIVNGTQYQLSDKELQLLISALRDIASHINDTSSSLELLYNKRKRQKGCYYTFANPFELDAFREWWDAIDVAKSHVVEPFAGECNIPRMMEEAGYNMRWRCYDLHSYSHDGYKVTKRDTLVDFPKDYNVCITNPPYLRKAAASRLKLYFPPSQYDDVYMLALEQILCHCKYAAVIVPESFVNAHLFVDRLECVISLNMKMFADTEFPVCLALFAPYSRKTDFYIGNEYIDSIQNLLRHKITYSEADMFQWVFNDPYGSIGVKCIDDKEHNDIRFIRGEEICSDDIKSTSRSYTRISGLPSNINLNAFIGQCNLILNEYRVSTHDVFLTSFKGLRKDGKYRRRIDFRTLRAILNQACKTFTTVQK